MTKVKTLARKISELNDPVIQDFDPEDEVNPDDEEDTGSEDEDSYDDLTGTEHYAQVGKSQLRKAEEVNLGPKYSGSKISRKDLLTDEENHEDNKFNVYPNDSSSVASSNTIDDVIENRSGDKFKEVEFTEDGGKKKENRKTFRDEKTAKELVLESTLKRKSKKSKSEEEYSSESPKSDNSDDQLDSDDLDDEESDSDDDDDDDIKNNRNERSEIQKIMKEDQKTVVSTISQAVKADVEKGEAVKAQRMRFDCLLNVRMAMQKALVAVNSIAALKDGNNNDLSNIPYESAEEAAVKLWNKMNDFRQDISKATSKLKTGQKRKRGIDLTTPSTIIWERLKDLEVASIDHRQAILEKWSAKTRGTSTLPLSEKLKPMAAQQSIILLLKDQLNNSEKLIKRTKIPRSCAPIQRDLKLVEDSSIYDDGNFYQMLLKEFIEQRKADSLNMPLVGNKDNRTFQWNAMKEVKTRKVVDTRASKGRKMRFTVHEKLQNFAAPEDRRSWESVAIDRLFGTLLGKKLSLDEDRQEEESDIEMNEEESLRLFRS
ncbi:Protein bfr2 [Golovinomyces cichoracearum]|uniref:Protein BFR2 n=1 Tax=Golovinomyces cichoracearum TaxID=62708 RepID=A0A420HHL0_9PEZI|nr:Protein bfr2 [Golovinomyces cichoracearum]